METMRKAAESAETDQFNPAIEAASGADADALQNGKIQNKVLKLTGEVQVLKIKLAKAQAAGDDTASIESKIAAEQCVSAFCMSWIWFFACACTVDADYAPHICRKKLSNNIATDKKSAGEASKGVA